MMMQPSHPPAWSQFDVFGGMSEEEYAKLPEPYRTEVAALWQWAQQRHAMRAGGGRVPMEDMDRSGARENELKLPPMVAYRLRRIIDQFEAALALMLLDDTALVDQAQEIIGTRSSSPRHTRFSAEDMARNSIDGAAKLVAIGLEETLINGLKHGIHGDLRKRVAVRRHWTPEQCVTQIEDDGLGYVRDELPDPLTALESGHGRGLLLTNKFADHVERNDPGTIVTITITQGFLRKRVVENLGQHLAADLEPTKLAERLNALQWPYYAPPVQVAEAPLQGVSTADAITPS